jgi:hypothetical protein
VAATWRCEVLRQPGRALGAPAWPGRVPAGAGMAVACGTLGSPVRGLDGVARRDTAADVIFVDGVADGYRCADALAKG